MERENSQTIRTAAETAATADLTKANITLHTHNNNLENIQMQPEDIKGTASRRAPSQYSLHCNGVLNDR